jgi:ribosome biogenesis GTPase A
MELTNNLDIAKRNPHATEMNVLVIGMPNVGKSTLLNSLRNMGIPGREFNSTLVPK